MTSEEFTLSRKQKFSITYGAELDNRSINDSIRHSSIYSFKDIESEIDKAHRQKDRFCRDLNINESMLGEKAGQYSQVFEKLDPKKPIFIENPEILREHFSYLSTADIEKEEKGKAIQKMLKLIQEQDKMIDDLQFRLLGRDEQIDVLEDELGLCRSNLVNMKKHMKEMKEAEKKQ